MELSKPKGLPSGEHECHASHFVLKLVLQETSWSAQNRRVYSAEDEELSEAGRESCVDTEGSQCCVFAVLLCESR